jgi:uncharacterized protein (DUF433 family)
MSQVVSLRLPDQEAAQLKRYARKLRRKTSETARILLGEALRQAQFPYVEIRDSAIGPQAYIKGRRVQVWMLVQISQSYGGDLEKTAKHLQYPPEWVQCAFDYAKAYPDEINLAIEENRSITFDDIKRKLSGITQFKFGTEDTDER